MPSNEGTDFESVRPFLESLFRRVGIGGGGRLFAGGGTTLGGRRDIDGGRRHGRAGRVRVDRREFADRSVRYRSGAGGGDHPRPAGVAARSVARRGEIVADIAVSAPDDADRPKRDQRQEVRARHAVYPF